MGRLDVLIQRFGRDVNWCTVGAHLLRSSQIQSETSLFAVGTVEDHRRTHP